MKNIQQWLILVIISAVFISCSNMSSVRTGDNYRKLKKEITENNYEKPVKELVSNDTEIITSESKIKKNFEIPPLNKQMAELQKGQKELKKDYIELKDEVNILKMRIKGLESQFAEKSFENNKNSAITGAEEKDNASNPYVLLPDEEVVKEEIPVKENKKETSQNITANNNADKKIINTTQKDTKKDEGYFDKYYLQIENKDFNNSIIELLKEERQLTDENLLAECRYLIGKIFLELNRYEKAHQYFAKIVNSDLIEEKKAEAYTGIAKSLLKKGMVAQAKDTYKRIIDNFPKTIYVVEAKKMLQKL